MTLNDFRKWLIGAEAGDRLTYHTGLLMADRQEADEATGDRTDAALKLDVLAHEVALAAENGFVHLRQSRSVDRTRWDYYVVRTEELAG